MKIIVEEKIIVNFILGNSAIKLFPFVKTSNNNGIKKKTASPLHGRSLIANYNKTKNIYTIIKGCGLTYYPYGFIYTEEFDDHIWGFLTKEAALRDFNCGNFIRELGVSTNFQQAIYELETIPLLRFNKPVNTINPIILQYTVKCPFRLADIPYMNKNKVYDFVGNWKNNFKSKYDKLHCIAAEVMLRNIRIMHENETLHNSISIQNYTLLLELVDFETSRTPQTNYSSKEDENNWQVLKKREVIQTLEIINYLAFIFKEKIEVKKLNNIMKINGFEI
jgi:hypothetical protein